jgi:hypothetical protein
MDLDRAVDSVVEAEEMDLDRVVDWEAVAPAEESLVYEDPDAVACRLAPDPEADLLMVSAKME